MLTFEMKVKLILCVIFAARIFQLAATKEGCFTSTKNGFVKGSPMTSRSGREFCAFLGIPYAAPPLGKLRFMPPKLPQNWEGVRDCTQEGLKCVQIEEGGSEDCLYLNVFTHTTLENTSLPTMVFIHGGGFFMGSSSLRWSGPEYLMDIDVVLVIIQYRLGPLGFMSTEDAVIPGNMGLKDQVKALQWVQENIKSFGGDKDTVTIFGNSAGAAAVHFHMLSRVSKSLFIRAISQSGTALSSFALQGKGESKKDAVKLAGYLNCPTSSSTEILYCLQNKTLSEIHRGYLKMVPSRYGRLNKIFRPVVEVNTEHAFLTENPINSTSQKPWLIGLNTEEGLWNVNQYINQTINYIHTDFRQFGPLMTYLIGLYSNMDEISDLMYQFYFENATSTEDTIKSIEELTTDSWFAWPTKLAITQHNGPLYSYLYDHLSRHSYLKMYGIKPLYRGVTHTDELLMLFSQNGVFPPLDGTDLKISTLMVNLWTNFATTGDPTPGPIKSHPQAENSTEMITWTESGNFDPTYFHIQTNNLTIKNELFPRRMKFWQDSQRKINYEIMLIKNEK